MDVDRSLAYEYRKGIYFLKEFVETKPVVYNNALLGKETSKQ